MNSTEEESSSLRINNIKNEIKRKIEEKVIFKKEGEKNKNKSNKKYEEIIGLLNLIENDKETNISEDSRNICKRS